MGKKCSKIIIVYNPLLWSIFLSMLIRIIQYSNAYHLYLEIELLLRPILSHSIAEVDKKTFLSLFTLNVLCCASTATAMGPSRATAD